MTLKQRLDACAQRAAFSTADLAQWLDLSYATVRSYRQGIRPYVARRPQIEERLSWLEAAIKSDPRLPVPLAVRASERKKYIQDILGAARDGRGNS